MVICLIGLKLGKVVINAFTVAKIALVTFMIIAGLAAWTTSAAYSVQVTWSLKSENSLLVMWALAAPSIFFAHFRSRETAFDIFFRSWVLRRISARISARRRGQSQLLGKENCDFVCIFRLVCGVYTPSALPLACPPARPRTDSSSHTHTRTHNRLLNTGVQLD